MVDPATVTCSPPETCVVRATASLGAGWFMTCSRTRYPTSDPSAVAWLRSLLVQTARYAEPALAELDASLLPGIARLRQPVKERVERLWGDGFAGCPELVYAAHQANCLLDESPRRLFDWLAA